MSKSIQLSLKAGERLYLNGAVIRVHRKVTIELLNEATFLLEGHVMQVEETTTPLRQLYFITQTILMDPRNAPASRKLFAELFGQTLKSFDSEPLREALRGVAALVASERTFEALKALRGLFPAENAILSGHVISARAA